MRVGVAHHLGWAVLVTASDDHAVVDRRRIELVDQDLPAAPIHHRGGAHEMHQTGETLEDEALAELVAAVRASAMTLTARALVELSEEVPDRIASISVRDWPEDFPADVATQRRSPYESQADSVMYRQVFAELAADRGWAVHRFDAKKIERQVSTFLGDRANGVLEGPRAVLGPPWTKDHRMALAATIVAAHTAAEL